MVSFIKIDPAHLTDTRLSRLFKLLSFHKQAYLEPTDFERLLSFSVKKNPYLKDGAP